MPQRFGTSLAKVATTFGGAAGTRPRKVQGGKQKRGDSRSIAAFLAAPVFVDSPPSEVRKKKARCYETLNMCPIDSDSDVGSKNGKTTSPARRCQNTQVPKRCRLQCRQERGEAPSGAARPRAIRPRISARLFPGRVRLDRAALAQRWLEAGRGAGPVIIHVTIVLFFQRPIHWRKATHRGRGGPKRRCFRRTTGKGTVPREVSPKGRSCRPGVAGLVEDGEAAVGARQKRLGPSKPERRGGGRSRQALDGFSLGGPCR